MDQHEVVPAAIERDKFPAEDTHADASASSVAPSVKAASSAPGSQRLWTILTPAEGVVLEPTSLAVKVALLQGRAPAGRSARFMVESPLSDRRSGERVQLPLPNGDVAVGQVNLVRSESGGLVRVSGLLDGGGTFSLTQQGERLAGRIVRPQAELAYMVAGGTSGEVTIAERWLSNVLCFNLPSAPTSPQAAPAESGPQAAPPLLSSRPSATAVLYLDFDGETVTDPDWNGGATINAAPSNLNSSQIEEVWRRVTEDFEPFNVDVTTDLGRYQNAPVGQRMRVIVTPTNEWAPKDEDGNPLGGIAYLDSYARAGSFDFTSDVPAWVFNTSVVGVAEAISHELGHTFGLSHDGRSNPAEEYFAGHGSGSTSWAPIMGVSYDRTVTQWSKGEYANANNQEDDVAIIAGLLPTPKHGSVNLVGVVSDEAGDSRESAVPIGMAGGAISQSGVIASEHDVDYYAFSTSAATVTVDANPAPFAPNLDIQMDLYDQNGSLLASLSPDSSMNASLSLSVPGGSYYLAIKGSGRAGPLTDGYSKYGSIGRYRISGSIYVDLDPAPVFTMRPLSRLALIGESVTFSAAAVGTTTVTYQWNHNGQPIPGATGATLSRTAVSEDDAGYYEVVATQASSLPARSIFRLHVAQPGKAVTGWGYNDYGQAAAPADGYPVASVAAGAAHSLALKLDGTVVGWGNSEFPETKVPTGLAAVVAIAANGNTSMALKSDGSIVVWGNNSYGQNNVPAQLGTVVDIAAGMSHCLALRADGTVVAWGLNDWGQASVPQDLQDVVGISAGDSHSIALIANGTVRSWGNNINQPSQVPPAGLAGVVSIAAGGYHNLALRNDGSVVAWGQDFNGQSTVPPGAIPARTVAAGSSHSLVIRVDGSVMVWGNNYYQQSVLPAGIHAAAGIAGGSGHSLALVAPVAPVIIEHPKSQTANAGQSVVLTVSVDSIPGASYQWRKNGVNLVNEGEVSGANSASLRIGRANQGDTGSYDVIVSNVAGKVTSNTANINIIVPPAFSTRPASRVAKEGENITLVADISGATSILWTHNGSIVPGANGSILELSEITPEKAGVYIVAATNSAGSTSSVVYVRVATENVIRAWGANDLGQRNVPIGLENVVEVSAGHGHTLALGPDGTVAAWGSNEFGQCDVPAGLSNVVQVSAGAHHSLALREDGSMVAWGRDNAGQASIPVGVDGVAYVSAGGAHTVALRTDGTVVAWGDNSYGQATVPIGQPFTHLIAAGSAHTLSITPSGLTGWGRNDFGQATSNVIGNVLGLQAGTNSSAAVRINGSLGIWGEVGSLPYPLPSNAAFVSLRDRHVLAVLGDGSIWAWGNNSNGEATVPVGVGNAVMVAAGGSHSVALIAPLPPRIVKQPASVGASSGANVSFSVVAVAAHSFIWQRNGVDLVESERITGVTSATLSIASVGPGDAGEYSVRLINEFGAAQSGSAMLTVQEIVVTNEAGVVANVDGSLVTLSVAVSGVGPFSFQWYEGESGDTSLPVAGATSRSVTVPQGKTRTNYWVRVTKGTIYADGETIQLGKWGIVDPAFERAELRAAVYAGERFVVVGEKAGFSDNGMDWENGSIDAGGDLYSVIHDGSMYFAGGAGGQVYSSANGETWQKRRNADPGKLYEELLVDGASGNGMRVFLGAANNVIVSGDGINWSRHSVDLSGNWVVLRSLTYGAGRYVAVGSGEGSNQPRIYHSTNGVSWSLCTISMKTLESSYVFKDFVEVVYHNGNFFAIGRSAYGGVPPVIFTSVDGVAWAPPVIGNVELQTARIVSANGQLVTGDMRTSADGITWSSRREHPVIALNDLVYGEGVYVAIGGTRGTGYSSIFTSGDLADWKTRAGFGCAAEIAYGNGRFVSISRERSGFSVDGKIWTMKRFENLTDVGALAYGNGLFVATGTRSSGPTHFISADGATWTEHRAEALGEYQVFSAISYAGGLWIGIAGGGIFTSENATDWVLRYQSAAAYPASVTYGNGRYVAVGWRGAVLTSADGVKWTEQMRPTDGHFRSVAFGNDLFAAVAGEGQVWTSSDGVEWVEAVLPEKSDGYKGYIPNIVFGNGEFHAAYGGDLLTSKNGLTWRVGPAAFPFTDESILLDYYVVKLYYGFGRFWATGIDGGRPFYWMSAPDGPTAPVFTARIGSRVATVGQSVTFSGSVVGENPMVFQWYKDGVAVPDATGLSLSLVNITAEDEGFYSLTASNSVGATSSESGFLTVLDVSEDIPDGFDVVGYLTRYPEHLSKFSDDPDAAWLYYRDVGIYDGEVYDDLFRPEEYLALYPELLAALGPDLKKALLHWLAEGRIEGRLGRIPLEFDVAGYFARNPDVAAAMGGNAILGWQHFWNYGIYEGRAYDDEFRAFEYLALNEDLQAAFLNDWRGATLHWLRYGRIEGRLGRVPPIFDVNFYLTQYPDVAAVWGTYQSTVFLHYYGFGVYEARIFDNEFRVDDYIALNPDLQAVFGTDRRGAFMHWVRWGRSEGRPARMTP